MRTVELQLGSSSKEKTDELAVGAALMDFEVALVVAVAADELSVDATQVDWLAVW